MVVDNAQHHTSEEKLFAHKDTDTAAENSVKLFASYWIFTWLFCHISRHLCKHKLYIDNIFKIFNMLVLLLVVFCRKLIILILWPTNPDLQFGTHSPKRGTVWNKAGIAKHLGDHRNPKGILGTPEEDSFALHPLTVRVAIFPCLESLPSYRSPSFPFRNSLLTKVHLDWLYLQGILPRKLSKAFYREH